MAIAHLATEYVFSDFLLKEPSEAKFKGLRLELAVDKMVTCIAVGLPLLLVSLAFAQEISIGEVRGWRDRGGLGRRHQRCPSLWLEVIYRAPRAVLGRCHGHMHVRDPGRPWRGTLPSGHKPR